MPRSRRPRPTSAPTVPGKRANAIPVAKDDTGIPLVATVMFGSGVGVIAFIMLWIVMGVMFQLVPATWVWYIQRVMTVLMAFDNTFGTSWQWNRFALIVVMSAPVLMMATLIGAMAARRHCLG